MTTIKSPALPYQPKTEGTHQLFDEMLEPSGTVRPHWQEMRAFLDQLGAQEVNHRWAQAERMVRDLGIAHPEGGGGNISHQWRLDPIPLILPASEWSYIERGILQRARLLNLLLRDFYGPQTTLERGLVPAELVLYNPNFLRPCHNALDSHGPHLHFYAADLARSPDGCWWVLSDCTQAPSGLGYVMQNRIILSRVFPEIFRAGHIHRLTGFFDKWQETLAGYSPRKGVEPRVVLLTAGPVDDHYFEHVFLSRSLGYPLVEGSDLLVREGRVYLKTLGGFHPVDVILRKVDDIYCDPLEFREDSLLGVPELTRAVRQGSVAVVNTLGSGVVKTPALNPFLPTLCRELLGEELAMPLVGTWWCGQPSEEQYVQEHLFNLIIRRSFGDEDLVAGSYLDPEQQAALRSQIKERPRQFVGQEHIRLSQAPVWVNGKLQPRSIVLRVFAAFDGQDFFVLPGALCRAARAPRSYEVSMSAGGLAKDVWVQCEDAFHSSPPLLLPQITAFRRGSADLPSRIADRMFWLGRYAERAEFTARLQRGVVYRLTLEQGWSAIDDILPLLRTLAHQGQLDFIPQADTAQELIEKELILAVFDSQRPGSLRSIIGSLLANAESVRDRLSQDTWRTLSELDEILPLPRLKSAPLADLLPLFNRCLLRLSAFVGQVKENMTAGLDLHFLELGRLMERALYTARLILETLPAKRVASNGRHEVLLETLDSIITYRQRYFHLQLFPMLDLLLADETNPRSLASQLRQIENKLAALPGEDAGQFVRPEEKLIHEGLSQIRLLPWNPKTPERTLAKLARALESLDSALDRMGDLLSQRYFSHARFSAHENLSVSTFPVTS